MTGTHDKRSPAEALRDLAPDCGDNSCLYGGRGKGGMRTNGGCRCFADLPWKKRHYVERMNHRIEELERDRDRALRIAYDRTPDCQTVEEAVQALLDILKRRDASVVSATQASMDRDWWRAQGIEACLDRMAIMGERLKNEQPRTLPSAACLAPATQPTIPGAISPSAQDIGQSAPPATQRSDWDVRDWYAAAKESGGAVCHEDGWCVIDREELARLQAPPSSIAQSEAERLWDRFIAHLNKIEPLIFKKEDGPQPHRNLHGSIKRYKAIFVASATQTSSAAQDSSTMNCAFQNGATTKGAKE